MNFLTVVFIVAFAFITETWFVMLGVGIIHAEWLPMLPTLGYWHAALVALAIILIASPIVYNMKS